MKLVRELNIPNLIKPEDEPHITLLVTQPCSKSQNLLPGSIPLVDKLPISLSLFSVLPRKNNLLCLLTAQSLNLTELHDRLYDALATKGLQNDKEYVHGLWYLHCMLALSVPTDQAGNVCNMLAKVKLPLQGDVEHVKSSATSTKLLLAINISS